MTPEQRRAHLFYLALLAACGWLPRESLISEVEAVLAADGKIRSASQTHCA